MNFMAALSAGIEPILGRGANSMTMSAGRNLGRKFSSDARRTDDLLKLLMKYGISFSQITVSGDSQLLLVFRDCMIRQALIRFGHPQQGSLCNMMYGFFAGALETIMGKKATLDIKHAGENGCLKTLT